MNDAVAVTVVELFARQIEQTPHATALCMADQSLSYQKLDQKSWQLAFMLRQEGVGQGDVVGIMVSRSIDMIIGIMAILRAGAAYLPLDPEYPSERLAFMIEDSGAALLLTQKELLKKSAVVVQKALFFEDAVYEESLSFQVPLVAVKPQDLAYVIYTSGSTGKPKGVMIEHRNVTSFIAGILKAVDFGADKTILCVTTISFDIFVLETLLALASGFKIVIANEDEQKNPRLLSALIVARDVKILQTTPSRLKLLLMHEEYARSLKNLNCLMTGGEALSDNLLEQLKKYVSGRIYNMYGPTETTVWSTVGEVTRTERITIGRPIAGTSVFIVDDKGHLCPPGAEGELCIAGEGVARGYHGREELTRQRFVNFEFAPGQTVYKTGDLVKALPGGEILYMGRIDHQVKLRGFRIELGEIESLALSFEGVRDAAAVVRSDAVKGDFLVLFYLAAQGIDPVLLRQHLIRQLPDYMVPSHCEQLESFPQTPNGKTDRIALLQRALTRGPGERGATQDYVLPHTKAETALYEAVCEVLSLQGCSMTDNFIALGGDSLTANIVAVRLVEKSDITVSATALIYGQSLLEIARSACSAGKSMVPVTKSCRNAFFPASSEQTRFFVMEQIYAGSTMYNMPAMITIQGELSQQRLQNALAQLVLRHEVLRTYFSRIDNVLIQNVAPASALSLDRVECEPQEWDAVVKAFIAPFDLFRPPLFRFRLIEVRGLGYRLLLDIHHAICDGISLQILIEELTAIYEGRPVASLPFTYRDYAIWQRNYFKSAGFSRFESFWKRRLGAGIPPLRLPYSRSKTNDTSGRGKKRWFEVPSETTEALKELAVNHRLTLNALTYGAFCLLMHSLSAQSSFHSVVYCADRARPELLDMVGTFGNFLVLRSRQRHEDTVSRFVRRAHLELMTALDNQAYVIEKLTLQKKKIWFLMNYATNNMKVTLGDVLFVFHNENLMKRGDDAKFTLSELYTDAATLDMILHVYPKKEGGMACVLQYRHELFDENFIDMLVGSLTSTLAEMPHKFEKKVDDLKALQGSAGWRKGQSKTRLINIFDLQRHYLTLKRLLSLLRLLSYDRSWERLPQVKL
jgi:amino acid adenylation domain-containing protein